MRYSVVVLLSIFLIFKLVSGCSRLYRSCLLVLDGVNVAETPSVLVEMEALNVQVGLSVSLHDLREFATVRLIVREASLRGHFILLSSSSTTEEATQYLEGLPRPRLTSSIPFNLDLSPDHITQIPRLIKERIGETPSLGRIIYLNSFGAEAKEKALAAVQSYQASGFKFVPLPECVV